QCSEQKVQRYLGKLSGPFLDRIDMQVEVPSLPPGVLLAAGTVEGSAAVRERVMQVHLRQQARCQGVCSLQLSGQQLSKWCPMTPQAVSLLATLTERFGLSARVCHRIIRLARTIADMAVSDMLTDAHIGEAFTYRCFHRFTRPAG